ncbi:autotransporter outer membrane beta-barrel domain-containing protein [Roseimicrobium sp. ORNL1]|uniref:autotransporter family protein n=1 Tax=Roseimicrobium sp. ORNL1 TaxID=2711231 RepID=UPI0013E0F3F8|nr:autotransporter outer membrane beta-barrel domain-containing protein [Roseimicrobium sp. ORNL1]QIF01491.1 autotransporter domain-containing protein [Roseimicrobium sp. ORNL1]
MGSSNFPSFGQTFQAPSDTSMGASSFTLAFQASSGDPGVNVRPYLYAYDTVNRQLTGPALYQGSVSQVANSSSGMELYTFTLPTPLALDAGQQYAVFVSVLDVPSNGPSSVGVGGFINDIPYPDGFLIASTAGNFADLFNVNAWTSNNRNLAFQILFAPLATNILQNSSPVNTDPASTFVVRGPSFTGTTTESNVINALWFAPGGSLQVYNNLEVTSGAFIVPTGRGTIQGGHLSTVSDFTKQGAGTLTVNSTATVPGNLVVAGGQLNVGNLFTVGSNALIGRGTRLTVASNGLLQVEGSTSVQGVLAVNGTLHTPHVFVGTRGTLQGNGLVAGNVTNNGVVAPGNSIGKLTIDGNFVQTSRGTLQIEVNGAGAVDRLTVSGQAHLNGTLDVRSLNADLDYGDLYTFLRAGRITGRFNRILMPDDHLLRGRFLNSGSTGTLLVAPASYTLVAQTQNQRSTARALDEWIGIENGDIGAVTLALDLLRAEQYPAAFEAIQPTYYEGALQTATELGHTHGQLLFQQFSARRLGSAFSDSKASGHPPLPSTTNSAKSSKNVLSSKELAVAPVENEKWQVWTQASGLFSSGGLSLTPGESFESGTILVGGDYQVADNLTVGLFGSYQEGWGDYDFGGDMDLRSTRFGAYANFDQNGFYMDLAVGGGQTEFDVKRAIQWATLNRRASSEPDGYEFFTMLGTGYDFHVGNWTLGPQMSLQYNKVDLGDFTETGAGVLNLQMRDADSESLRSYIGGRIAYTIAVNERTALIPELRAFWQHEYLGDGDLHSALDGGSGPEFMYQMSDENPDAVFIGTGLGLQVGANFYANVYYNVGFGQNDDANHTVSVTASWRF